MNEITFRIHWLSFTVHTFFQDGLDLYENLFKDTFGPLTTLGHGGRGFREILIGMCGIKVYIHPTNENAAYFHIEIPGEACDLLRWEYYFALANYLESNWPGKYSFKRIDLAFDNVPFTPQQFEQAVLSDNIRSLAKRKSLEIHNSPNKLKDNGELGCYTVTFGSRSSNRMVRVYDKRGFTRIELETTDDRAHHIGIELFNMQNIEKLFPVMISHLLDFIQVNETWWDEFTKGNGRAYLTISEPRTVELNKLKKWLETQVMPSFSAVLDILPGDEMSSMIKDGRRNRNPKLDALVNNLPMGKGTP